MTVKFEAGFVHSLALVCKCARMGPHLPMHTHSCTDHSPLLLHLLAPSLFAGAAEVFFISHAYAVLDSQHSVLHKYC